MILHLTENHIRQLHQQLLRHSNKDERHRVNYKTLANHVVAKDKNGLEIGIVFETTSPFDTPREMEELVKWTVKAINEASIHPLLIVAIFSVLFLAIHPSRNYLPNKTRVMIDFLKSRFQI